MKIITRKKRDSIIFKIICLFFFLSISLFFLFFHEPPIDISVIPVMIILFLYASCFRKIENLPSYIDLMLLIGMIIVVFFSISIISQKVNDVPENILSIAKVSAFGMAGIGFVMLVTLLFDNLELSLLFSIFVTLLGMSIESVGGESIAIGASLFCASLASALFSYRLRRRSQIIKAVFFSVIIFFATYILENIGTLIFIGQIKSNILWLTLIILVSSIVMMILLPVIITGVLFIFEYLFKTITNISLLELSDFNSPLLRKLILKTPGTYQHSLMVANLAEAAAEAIGANSLLARVGAYYHDIGKIPKGEYFMENQIPYKDIHKKLKPSMSRLIIMNHVKEGVELAKKYKLNPRIIDFITQHHGRSLVYYFYQRAKELEPHMEHAEEEYRYPGPKPQSKEIAIVSLADTIEAISRSLDDPTPSRIEEMVREVVRKKFIEGELDESDLTLKDLEKIIQSFVRVLNAVFHTRINYPKDESKDKKYSEDKTNR